MDKKYIGKQIALNKETAHELAEVRTQLTVKFGFEPSLVANHWLSHCLLEGSIMMTRHEAEERAKKIWGEATYVEESGSKSWPTWTVYLAQGMGLHRLDSNGHTDCHSECAQLEDKVENTRTYFPADAHDDNLRDLLTRISALCTNPHWTSERRWTIAELAAKGLRLLEGKDK